MFTSSHAAHTILRRKQVEAATGYARSTIYLRISQGLLVKPVSLGPRAVGFPAGEIASLNAARIAGKSDDEIRALVTKLHAARNGALPASGVPAGAGGAAIPSHEDQLGAGLSEVSKALARKGFAMRSTAAGIHIVPLDSHLVEEAAHALAPVTATLTKDEQ